MSIKYQPQNTRLMSIFRLVLAHRSPSSRLHSTSPKPPSPSSLNPDNIPVNSLGLPLRPLLEPIPTITPQRITLEKLHKLHRLSALNPPPDGSEEEQRLMLELGELMGLMELVEGVEMPDKDRMEDLLSEGVGEVVIGVPENGALDRGRAEGQEEPNGRELLGRATRRVGDYYASKVERKIEE